MLTALANDLEDAGLRARAAAQPIHRARRAAVPGARLAGVACRIPTSCRSPIPTEQWERIDPEPASD